MTIAPLLRLVGRALRITLKDELILTWPSRRASDGRRCPIIEPFDQALIRSVEAAVIAKYLAVRGERHITNRGRPE